MKIFHEQDRSARMITGHYFIFSEPQDSSPLNFLCSDALSPALRSTGSCEQESSLFILPTNVDQL